MVATRTTCCAKRKAYHTVPVNGCAVLEGKAAEVVGEGVKTEVYLL
jgi:hypothetical protein